MSKDLTGVSVLIMSASWGEGDSELAFVTRAIAGAASRTYPVSVVTPMPAGDTVADGAFDIRGIGQQSDKTWPRPEDARWEPVPDPRARWLLDEPSPGALALAAVFGNGASLHSVKPGATADAADVNPLPLVSDRGSEGAMGVYVPVHSLAAAARHGGLGFTDYLLVLTDRPGTLAVSPPTPAVAWMTARFHDQYVVVVEGGRAAVWKGRALRGVVSVDTRIDLWRLMAHAWTLVDLDPGDLIARECIESLRFGTPIIVPETAPGGAAHALAGGGFTFSDVSHLLERIEHMLHRPDRARCGRQGADYANARYGDPSAFVDRVSGVFRS